MRLDDSDPSSAVVIHGSLAPVHSLSESAPPVVCPSTPVRFSAPSADAFRRYVHHEHVEGVMLVADIELPVERLQQSARRRWFVVHSRSFSVDRSAFHGVFGISYVV